MLKRVVISVLVFSLFGSNLYATEPAMQVQLPFIDGGCYECMQNSDDAPTHGRNDNYDSVNAPFTIYDLDFGLRLGTIITAAANGTISYGENPGGFGNYAKIDHGNGYFTLYAHLLDNGNIAEGGSIVAAGQPIAFSGSTGNSKGPHLHFGLHQGTSYGTSVRMDVKAREYSSAGSYLNEGFFATGSTTEREMYCSNESGLGNNGNKYEAIPLSGLFNQFQCHSLDDNHGILCWQGYNNQFAFCDEGHNHARYYRSGGGFRSEKVTLTGWNVIDMCYPISTNGVNLYSYLNGGSVGVGGAGTVNLPNEAPSFSLPNFITTKSWLSKQSDGEGEDYEYYPGEQAFSCSTTKNVGEADSPNDIKVMFLRSDGYKEDSHNEWEQVGDLQNIRDYNLEEGESQTECAEFHVPTTPGVYNIVSCPDRTETQYNEDGDVLEEHESDNCSTEAVFSAVDAPVDFSISDTSLTKGRISLFQWDKFGLRMIVENQGEVQSPIDIRNGYYLMPPSATSWQYKDDDTTRADQLCPGCSREEYNTTDSFVADIVGTWKAMACTEIDNKLNESDETNNCKIFSFIVNPPPPPEIAVTSPKSGDKWRCDDDNDYKYIKWTNKNFPSAGTVSLYYTLDGGASWRTISSSTANDGSYKWHMCQNKTKDVYGYVKVVSSTYKVFGISQKFYIDHARGCE
jgi:murein DD-endopeptidase MepM/ murein hydrolase activator NlpD